MELPVPQLTTLETITVVFLCFVAVQIFLALSKRQRRKEARHIDMSKMAIHEVSLVDYPVDASASARTYTDFSLASGLTQRTHSNGDVEYFQSRDAASQQKYVPIQGDWTPEQIEQFKDYFDAQLQATEAPSQPKCPTPPNGWDCSRDIGHPGPCAASPSKSSASEGGAS